MDCNDALKRLYAFLDKELAPTDAAEVKSHLARCDDCPDNFAFEQQFLDLIRDCGTSDVAPANLRERVISLLHTQTPPPA